MPQVESRKPRRVGQKPRTAKSQAAWLFIDTTKSGEFRSGFLGQTVAVAAGLGRSNKFLSALARRLTPQKLEALSGICVVAGPGSFTAVRTGVLVANLLARLYGKPLCGVSVEESQDLKNLAERLLAGKVKSSTYVAPEYYAEPNITLKQPAGKTCYV